MAQQSGSHGSAARSNGARRGLSSNSLPSPSPSDIPDKLYFRIGEVARLCAVEAYVLRFWETEFPQLRPNKGGTGQRLFRRRDVEMAMRIRRLLYDEGYTIPGARQLLRSEARPHPPAPSHSVPPAGSIPRHPSAIAEPGDRAARLQHLHQGLRELHALLSEPPGALLPAASLLPPPPPARPRAPRSPAFRRFHTTPGLFDPPVTPTDATAPPAGSKPA